MSSPMPCLHPKSLPTRSGRPSDFGDEPNEMKLTACPILAAYLDPPMILKEFKLHIVCSEVSVAIKLLYKI